jgi:hypothetical protein
MSVRLTDLSGLRPRITGMPLRGLLSLGIVACSLALPATRSVSEDHASASVTRISRHGIAVLLPPRWHVVDRRLTPCVDPSERLTVAGDGALVMLQERLRPVAGEFPARSSTFALHGRPAYMECCAPLTRRGWMLRFEDNGRGFYAYVYLGRARTRSEALVVLDSLRVTAST